MNILEELYNGKIYPFENIIPQDKKYQEINGRIGELREYFSGKLSAEDKEKFENWNDLIYESRYMEDYENFAYGFRLGVRLIIDAMPGRNMVEI